MKGIQLTDYDLDVKVRKDSSGKIVSGLALGDILHQNQAVILTVRKGELKEFPSVGVGVADMLLEHDFNAIRSEIRKQLELDGQIVSSVQVTEHGILIDAKY